MWRYHLFSNMEVLEVDKFWLYSSVPKKFNLVIFDLFVNAAFNDIFHTRFFFLDSTRREALTSCRVSFQRWFQIWDVLAIFNRLPYNLVWRVMTPHDSQGVEIPPVIYREESQLYLSLIEQSLYFPWRLWLIPISIKVQSRDSPNHLPRGTETTVSVSYLVQLKNFKVVSVRYHCGGWPEEVNSCLLNSYMVYL